MCGVRKAGVSRLKAKGEWEHENGNLAGSFARWDLPTFSETLLPLVRENEASSMCAIGKKGGRICRRLYRFSSHNRFANTAEAAACSWVDDLVDAVGVLNREPNFSRESKAHRRSEGSTNRLKSHLPAPCSPNTSVAQANQVSGAPCMYRSQRPPIFLSGFRAP